MPLQATVRYPRPDVAATTDAIHERMVDLVTEACKSFVFSCTDVIPVLTGGSKATFLKLAFQAKVSLAIAPVKASRIDLGVASSTGQIFAQRGRLYGFEWSSDLYYIHYVDARFAFVERGKATIRSLKIQLPPPIIIST